MTTRKHGGPRPNSGGARPGAGRKPKHRQHIRPYVPVETEDEARLIQALPPDERRARLLRAPTPGTGAGREETTK